MRRPATNPVVGSVPRGRRKSRMCGSGLRCNMVKTAGVSGVLAVMSLSERTHTDGWHNEPSHGSAARRVHATHSPKATAPLGRFLRRAWGESRDCAPRARLCELAYTIAFHALRAHSDGLTGTRSRHRSTSRSTRCPATSYCLRTGRTRAIRPQSMSQKDG